MSILTLSGLHKNSREGTLLEQISFSLEAGEKLAIAGETGSGKTSLLKMIAGMAQPGAGTIAFDGYRVRGSEEKLLPGHPGIAYLSQHFELRNHYRVNEILAFQNELSEAESANLYALCRIDHLLERRTDQLSGGERQRIALAHLLIKKPKLLLLDEPFSNLDWKHKSIVRKVISDIKAALHLTMIMVSHEPAEILSWADRLIFMHKGRFIQDGKPEDLFHKPFNTYAAGLLGPFSLVSTAVFIDLEKRNDKKHFIRPGSLAVTDDSSGSQQITVTDIRYEGNQSLIEASVTKYNETLFFYSNPGLYKKGDMAFIRFTANDYWLLDG
jgi:ABC-type sugar transport system ATPase subunit